MKKAIFWFRQDLRIFDNLWFIKSIIENDEILPIFIFDKNIVSDFGWLNDQKFWFLRDILEYLDTQISSKSNWRLNVFYDFPEKIIPFLMNKYQIDSIYANKTYSNYWVSRDNLIGEIIKKDWKNFYLVHDFLLVEPTKIPQRKVFTPFFKLWEKEISEFILQEPKYFKVIEIDEKYNISDFINISKHPYFTLDFWINRFDEYIKEDYGQYRNDLDKDWTSKLSPYIRFWVFSIRQIYNKAIKTNKHFIQELAWREFWHHISYYFPETKDIEFQETKRNINWKNNPKMFDKWCKWETGYPIVDACMKQLLETNRMHGRGRMIVASFLTKDLLIDWRWGEAFFKKHLLDYDEALNYWNWQWSASVWADPKPLRIFNPILQSQKFDSDTKFIKKYIPQLELEKPEHIHDPIKNILWYHSIIINHNEAQKEAKIAYKGSKEKITQTI